MPDKEEVFSTLSASNLSAAAGTDSLLGLPYKVCWDSLGNCLTNVVKELFIDKSPTVSMRTALMVYSPKPKKPLSVKPSDKRQLNIINTDFTIYEGQLARRFRKLSENTLSP